MGAATPGVGGLVVIRDRPVLSKIRGRVLFTPVRGAWGDSGGRAMVGGLEFVMYSLSSDKMLSPQHVLEVGDAVRDPGVVWAGKQRSWFIYQGRSLGMFIKTFTKNIKMANHV